LPPIFRPSRSFFDCPSAFSPGDEKCENFYYSRPRSPYLPRLRATDAADGAAEHESGAGHRQQRRPEFQAIHDAYVRDSCAATRRSTPTSAARDSTRPARGGRPTARSFRRRHRSGRPLARRHAKIARSIAPDTLSPTLRIDREVALAQIRFLLRQHGTRKYQQRALDTYTDEPFRAIDWQLQGMTQTGEKSYGTPEEWSLVVKRLQAVPRYFQVAQEQLAAGIKSGNTPDHRMLLRNGIETAEKTSEYFAKTLPNLAKERVVQDTGGRDELLKGVDEAAKGAADAYLKLRDFVAATFVEPASMLGNVRRPIVKAEFSKDRFAMSEEEYNWALKNNLRMPDATAAKLFDESMAIVNSTQQEMITLAREIGKRKTMELPEDGQAAVLKVFEELGKDYPKSDAEMVKWYEEAAFRLVEYGRKSGVFDVPADYKLEVVETPPPLRASIDGAAYYPAPPFKTSGVGRFYVTTSGSNDEAVLKENNRASLADLAAHEGFPGHDWHYKVMTQYRDRIAPARWLTPGAVEDSSSMWQDSMAAEGWGLYSEALMSEPQPGFPTASTRPKNDSINSKANSTATCAFALTPGIHTNRMTYDEAVDLFSQVVDFQPGSCRDAAAGGETGQARQLRLGRTRHLPLFQVADAGHHLPPRQRPNFALRKDAAQIAGERFSPKTSTSSS
jgi:uncharacterized protein (DUF885 family)